MTSPHPQRGSAADPITPELQARIRQCLILGTARSPITTPPALAPLLSALPPATDPTLALLVLAGQRQRFVVPETAAPEPVPEAARAMHADPRPILPAAARLAFGRLTRSVEKAHAPAIIGIAAQRIAKAGLRLHPFDLPELARHLKADTEGLGLAERAFLALTARDANAEDAGRTFFQADITAETWTRYGKAERRKFIAGLRRTDAAGARALVESVWKAEPAPVRFALLEGLAPGLSLDDKPFLASLEKDRAETVRQLAAALIARIPQSESYEQRLKDAAACFTRPTASGVSRLMSMVGLQSESKGLTFQIPDDPATDWGKKLALRERLFAGLSVGAIAEAAGVTADEIIAALPADEHQVLLHFIETARVQGEADEQARLVGARLLSSHGLPTHLLIDLVTRAPAAVLSRATAELLLTRKSWADAVAQLAQGTTPGQQKDDGRLVHAAALMPRDAMPAFVASIAAVPASAARAARDLADFILALPDTAPRTPPTDTGAHP